MKSVNKIIKFYILRPSPTVSYNGNNLDLYIPEIFKSAFKGGENFCSINLDNRKLYFDIKKFDDLHMFGTFSALEKIEPSSMILSRNKNTHESAPFTTNDSEYQLEAYTFFYIDFCNKRMAAISSKKLPKIDRALHSFIWNNQSGSSPLGDIEIYPERIDNLSEVLEKFNSIKSLNLTFAQGQTKNNMENLFKSISNDFSVDTFDIKLKISKHGPSFIPSVLNYFKNSKRNELSKISLDYVNDLGLNETLNLIECLYTKNVAFALSDDILENQARIEEILKHYLDLHIQELKMI